MDKIEPHYGCVNEEVLSDKIECAYCGRTFKEEYYGQEICFVCEEEKYDN
jgi:hypothetical protein